MTLDHVAEVVSGLKPLARLDRPLEMVRQFTPNWFAATMGTGVLALVLPQLPGLGARLRPLAEGLWWFDVGLFLLFAGLYARVGFCSATRRGAYSATASYPCSSAQSPWGSRPS